MPVIFRCKCNQKLRVSRSKSGSNIRCPSCQIVLEVPHAQPKPDETIWVDAIDETHMVTEGDLIPPAHSNPGNAATGQQYESKLIRNPSAAPPTDEASQRRLILMGSFAFLGLCLIVSGIVLAMMFVGKRQPIANHQDSNAIPRPSATNGANQDSSPSDRTPPTNHSNRPNNQRPKSIRAEQPKTQIPIKSKRPSTNSSTNQNKQEIDPNWSSEPNALNPLAALNRLIDKGADTTAQDLINAAKGNDSYPDEIPGMADELGLNYFTDQLTDLVFLNVGKVNRRQTTRLNLTELNPIVDKMEDLTGRDSKSIDHIICGMSGVVRSVATFRDQPQMYLIRYNESIDSSGFEKTKGIKAHTIAGVKVYIGSDGVCFGLPDSKTLIGGNRNEVLYAMRFSDRKKNFSHFAWLDFKLHDSVYFQGRQSAAGFFGYRNVMTSDGNRIRNYQFVDSKRRAQLVARHATLYQQLQHGELSAEKFWKKYEDLAVELRFPFARPNPETIAQTARQVEAGRQYIQQQKANQDVKHLHRGRMYIVETSYKNRSQTQTLWNTVSALKWRNQFIRNSANSQATDLRKYLQQFETYQFKDDFDREQLESKLIRSRLGVSSWQASFGESNAIGEIAFALNHTSSRRVRHIQLVSLAESTNPQAIGVLALEAQMFDLADGLGPVGEEDDKPEFLISKYDRRSGSRDKSWLRNLEKTLSYYLHCPGDPEMLIAICQILNDVVIKDLKPALLQLEKDEKQPEAVRQASRRALAAYLDPNKRNHNTHVIAKDIEECKKWLVDPLRPKRLGAINWTMDNEWPKESRAEILKGLILMLDDAIHCEQALASLKKNMKLDEVEPLHQIIQNAINPRETGYRQRQDYTMVRVADLLAHLKDGQGLVQILKLRDFDARKIAKTKMDELKVDGSDLVDELLAEPGSTKGNIRELVDALEHVALTTEQQEKVAEWIEQQVAKDRMGISLWDLYRKCDPYRKEKIKTLIVMWARDYQASSSIANYLKKYGPAIEPLLLDEIRRRNHEKIRIGSNIICSLLEQVGTEASIEVLEPYLNHDRERDQERARNAIETIRNANRQPVDFDSFPDPSK